MAMVGYFEIILAFLCFVFIYHWSRNRNSPGLTSWPVVRMLRGLLSQSRRGSIHEYLTQSLKQGVGTLEFKGPWFSKLEFIITCDPMNVNHILSRNFANYEKGSEFREIFDELGDGIFNTDSDAWKIQRKMMQSLMKNNAFELFLAKTVYQKVVKGLRPVFDHFSELGMEVDMQDLFKRFTFDNICSLVLGFDPNCLSVEFPEVPHAKAFDDMEEAVIYRHIVPTSVWKLQKWLQIGEEKRLKKARDIFDSFVYQCISTKQEELRRSKTHVEEKKFDLLTAFMDAEEEEGQNFPIRKSDKYTRDVAFNLLAAGRDTISAGLTWFFYLVATNPSVETKILEEIESNFPEKEYGKWSFFNTQELNRMVYLHAALCETLRLYPPVPINHKTTVQAETLPSGHRVHRRTRVLITFYAMGRMQDIWGEDCLQFKPERWISERGSIRHVPSYIFTAFNAGPRTCVGKDMSFIQMKIVAMAVLRNYRIQVEEGHTVSPCNSVILHMKGGLKVRITKRCVG